MCLCCEHLQHHLSNWWRCFLNLLVLFAFACVFWGCSMLRSLGHCNNGPKPYLRSKGNSCKMWNSIKQMNTNFHKCFEEWWHATVWCVWGFWVGVVGSYVTFCYAVIGKGCSLLASLRFNALFERRSHHQSWDGHISMEIRYHDQNSQYGERKNFWVLQKM